LSYNWFPSEQIEEAALPNPVVRTEFTTSYTVIGRIGGCTATDQVVVKSVPYPQVNAGADTVLCYKSSGQLAGTTDGSSILWSPTTALSQRNILNPVVNPLKTTDYVLTVYDTKGCPKPGKDTVTVVVLDPIKPFAGRDTAVLIDQPMQFNASGGVAYQWSPAIGLSATDLANPVGTYTTPSQGTKYKVRVFNEEGCVDSAYITVKVFATGPTVFVPNAFTPNSDGLNDQLRPIAVGIKTIESFSIFNRWGQLVFSTTINGKGWDGKINGQPQRSESFVWVVQAVDYTNKRYLKKGMVTLIR
jgi:gliding motility-associated-like protein